MAATSVLIPSTEFRRELRRRGGTTASRCYQCATCSSVCELAPPEAPFPRRQMLLAQWGLVDQLAADPAVWLCHNCKDCSERCPREANPGDVLGAVRSLTIERLAFPSFLGRTVGRVRSTWPVLLAVPLLFWIGMMVLLNGFEIPAVNEALSFVDGRFHYDEFVPHWLIYVVYFAISAWVVMAASVSGRRFWKLLGTNSPRHGSFLSNLWPALVDVATHRRFASCNAQGSSERKWGHLLVLWGFVGAAVTSGLLVVYLYGYDMYPLPLTHWVKWLGNISAVILVIGGLLLLAKRYKVGSSDRTTAFDWFFLWLVVGVIFTGVFTEVARFALSPAVAVILYLVHLSLVMTLFVTFPYSKFAHMLYRTLAMVHERMTSTPAKA